MIAIKVQENQDASILNNLNLRCEKVLRFRAQRDRRKYQSITDMSIMLSSSSSSSLIRLTKPQISNKTNILVSTIYLLSLISLVTQLIGIKQVATQQQALTVSAISTASTQQNNLPDLASSTSDEPIVAVVGQDAFISCVAKNLQNYTIIWRYTNEANAPGVSISPATSSSSSTEQQLDVEANSNILTAGRQRVISDNRFSVIQSHDTWLLKISNVRQSDTGTYVCHTNSKPIVRVLRILSVVKPGNVAGNGRQDGDLPTDSKENWGDLDYSFTDCCRAEFVNPRCQRLCSFQQLSSRYRSINIVHDCYPSLPAISRCMVGGRNVTDCCERRHIPQKCKPMCGHQGDISSMSVQDQSYCADYSASIMSCVAEGIDTLPGQPELVIVEAVSSTTLKVSWQKVSDENELRKIDGWIINLTKLSSFEDTITTAGSTTSRSNAATSDGDRLVSAASSSSSSASMNASTNSISGQQATRISSSFSTSVSPPFRSPTAAASNPLDGLNIVDAMNNSSLASMTKLLSASSGSSISLKLDKSNSEFSIDNLKPYTVYQIQMFAYNSYGRSQLTDPIRALTLAPESSSELSTSIASSSSSSSSSSDAYVEPTLPNTRKCCLDRGVTLKRCLDTLCDPVEADRATIADLMICAPWSNVTFGCLSSHVNHTDCCKSRGVSPFCLTMCSGDVKRVDYRHFRCLTHMSTYTNCILESHNVLPSAPLNFTVGPITSTWAVLNWRSPKRHAKSLQGYRIFWRRFDRPLQPDNTNSSSTSNNSNTSSLTPPRNGGSLFGDNSNDEFFYSSAEAATNPYLLDALQPNTVYETFVVAVNRYGQSDSSVRFVFQTLVEPTNDEAGTSSSSDGNVESRLPLHGNSTGFDRQNYYNETDCCIKSGVHDACKQLCDYDMKVSDVPSLISHCNSQMPVILRCMAGSRNNVPCCRTRGVSDHCLNVCAGLTEQSPLVVATRCASDFGKMMRCMDEGSKQIPGAPIDLHTVEVKPDQVNLKWSPSSEDSLRTDIEYHVRYQQLQPSSSEQTPSNTDLSALIAVVPLHPLEHNLVQSTNRTEATVDKLKPNSRYSIYLTAENAYGISLPSLVLIVQTPDGDQNGASDSNYNRRATLGSPHSLEILRSDTETIVLKWIAPLFISSDAQIKYRVFYKMLQVQVQNQTQDAIDSTSSGASGSGTNTNEAVATQQVAGNWSVLETNETTAMLKNLKYSSQYVITVQAYSKQMLGHMSEILLAQTAKPVPPTLNHPLVINNPIEGNNITIMCVALGQPTPQISMFINGLLVQKRTQPYVFYHLVNLVRGHLTITCFASNGHGKDYASVQSRTEVSVKFPTNSTAKVRQMRASLQSVARMTCEVSGNPQPTVVWTFTRASNTGVDTTGSRSSVNMSSSSSSVIEDQSAKSTVITPGDRITTLLVSKFENPFTWSHTLTIRNVSQSDLGTYQCRARNMLSESLDSIQLNGLESTIMANNQATDSSSQAGSYVKLVEQNSDLMECCKSQNVSTKCLPVCSVDGLDVESAFKIPECQIHLDKLMFCAADGSDHRNCCRTRQVPTSCLRWCSGARLNSPALCFLSSAIDINQCFQEGKTLLPGPPRNVRVMLASESDHSTDSEAAPAIEIATTTSTMVGNSIFSNRIASPFVMSMSDQSEGSGSSSGGSNSNGGTDESNSPSTLQHSKLDHTGEDQEMNSSQQQQQQQQSEPLIIEWDPPMKNPALAQYYRIFWRPFGSRELSRTVTNMTWIKLTDLSMNKMYEFVVKAANNHGSSIYSDMLTVKPSEILAQSNSISSAGLSWFMHSSSSSSNGGGGSLIGRVLMAVCFATVFMFTSLALVVILEKRGYLRGFASSKSNSSRVSFANPAYLKDSNGDNNHDGDNITWSQEPGHSLDILAPPPLSSSSSSSSQPPTQTNVLT